MFTHDRTPPARWQTQLNRFRRGDRTSYPLVVWMPGERYEPVQRWVIYEMVPNLDLVTQGMPADDKNTLLAELTGPSPRAQGTWRSDPSVSGGVRWHSKALISKLQWDLYQHHKAWPQLTWIIQGDRGGHQWHLSQAEWAHLRMRGATCWPAPGELPYAELDSRVLDQLAKRDKLAVWEAKYTDWEQRYAKRDGSFDPKTAGLVAGRDLREERIELHAAVEKFLESQLYGVQDAMTGAMAKHILEDAPVTPGLPDDLIQHEWRNQ